MNLVDATFLMVATNGAFPSCIDIGEEQVLYHTFFFIDFVSELKNICFASIQYNRIMEKVGCIQHSFIDRKLITKDQKKLRPTTIAAWMNTN